MAIHVPWNESVISISQFLIIDRNSSTDAFSRIFKLDSAVFPPSRTIQLSQLYLIQKDCIRLSFSLLKSSKYAATYLCLGMRSKSSARS